jgi:poly(3-hydroxybutyrate) depolymerase
MLFNPVDSRSLYNLVDNSMRMMKPISDQYLKSAKQLIRVSDMMNLPGKIPFMPENHDYKLIKESRYNLRAMAGTLYVWHMLLDTYQKPEFGIDEVKIDENYYEIVEKIVSKKSFCDLIHFDKVNYSADMQPKMLIVAPMSGHHATLLRGTVQDMLPFYDVYITDWKSARDVPLTEGGFDLDEFTNYLISYMHELGPDINIMAVCQSTVPVLIALALMSADDDPNLPNSTILLGGPIDTDKAPTSVNQLATSRGDDWFKKNVISIVPSNYPGYMRPVYPGFLQLSGFMNMNLQKHMESLHNAIKDFASDKREGALKVVNFYTEYFSTMDLTAEFYMQTIDTVFQRKLLTKGKFKCRGRYANLKDIQKTSILAIEGGHDDITGIGQTKSVLDLCTNIKDSKKKYYLAEEVGHYGLFNGSKFRKQILPEIKKFTHANKLH